MKKLFTNKRKEKFIRWIERVIGYEHPPIKVHDFTEYKREIKMIQSKSIISDMELEILPKSIFIHDTAISMVDELLKREAISIKWGEGIGKTKKLIIKLYYIEDMETLKNIKNGR